MRIRHASKMGVCVRHTYRILTHVSDTDTRRTLVRFISVKHPIQKIFVGFLTILARFEYNVKK